MTSRQQRQQTAEQAAQADLTDSERHALELAGDLRDRVRREREVVRRLRAYLDRTVDPT